jgi:RNA polymerase sigma-70 factor, ECF subfamily
MTAAENCCLPAAGELAWSAPAAQHGHMFTTADEAARAWRAARDEAAARWLTERLWPLLAGIALRHLPRGAAVEDLVQESLARAFTRIHRWNPARPFEPWVCAITTHVCLDALRHRKRRPEWRWSDLTDEEQSACHAAHTDSSAGSDAHCGANELLVRLLDTLGATDRIIVTLLHLEQKSVAEISALTGVTRLMVRVRAHRARTRMKKALAELEATRTP